MNTEVEKRKNWKQKILHEMIEYYLTALYMAIFFAAFSNYRRLILAHYQISYTEYGISIIKAMVLGKVVLVAESMRIGRAFKDRPSIIPTMYKSFLFTICVGLFNIIEGMIKGFVRRQGLSEITNHLIGEYNYEWLAGALVVFFAFIPFFAARELREVLGKGTLFRIFFRNKWAVEPEPGQMQSKPGK